MADRSKDSELELDLKKIFQKYTLNELEQPEAPVHNDVFPTKEFNKLLQSYTKIAPTSANPSKSCKNFNKPNPTFRKKELQVKRQKTMLKYHIRSFMPVLPIVPLAKCSSQTFKSKSKLKQRSNYQQIRRCSALPVRDRFDKSLEVEIEKFFIDTTSQIQKRVWFDFKVQGQDLPSKIVSNAELVSVAANEAEETEALEAEEGEFKAHAVEFEEQSDEFEAHADKYEILADESEAFDDKETEEPEFIKIETENTQQTLENGFEPSTTIIYPIQYRRIQIEIEEMQDLPIQRLDFPTTSVASTTIPEPVIEDDENQWTDVESEPESAMPIRTRRRALKQTKLHVKNNRIRHYRPEIEETTSIESEFYDATIGNGDIAVKRSSSIQTKLDPVVIPSNRRLLEYHNYLCALPIPAFLQNEMESKAERVFINGFEHLKDFLNFVQEKYKKPTSTIDRSYAYNLEALQGEEDLMIRQMERKKHKHLKVQDILDRYDTLQTVMPVSPMKNLFYIHMKEFMRKFPADNYATVKIKTRSKKLRPNRVSGMIKIEDLPIATPKPILATSDVAQKMSFMEKLKVNLLDKILPIGRNCWKVELPQNTSKS